MTSRFQEAKRIFSEAVDLPPGEREPFLRKATREDEELRRAVSTLLAADEGGFDLQGLAPPEIEGFQVLCRIGEGGMGTVFLAEQESPHRRVALKVLATPFPDEEALRRFRYEAEILGRLDHGNIAKIFAAGVTSGRPYFAMELVSGVPLTDYAKGLDLPARVDLLAQVCDAVQHAHGRGVIHRDLKPANVLVDAQGSPKLLDFGVAKVLGEATARRTMETRAGQLLGTLPYMSPEQLGTDPDAVDVRSDVYSLGVMAFEVIAGRKANDLSGLTLHEAIVRLRERDLPRLGTLSGRWRGDLETIVAKAVAKDPRRRYDSAGDLAADLRRFRNDEPILARPPSLAYQMRKFARRNRVLVAGVCGIFLSLVAGLIVSLAYYKRAEAARGREQVQRETAERNAARAIQAETLARNEEDKAKRNAARATQAEVNARSEADKAKHSAARAVQAEALARNEAENAKRNAARATQAETKARSEAETAKEKSATAQKVTQLLVHIFEEADPTKSHGKTLTVHEALDKGASKLVPQLKDEPAVRADLEFAIGSVYHSLGLDEQALPHLKQALKDRKALHKGPNADVADALQLVGEVYAFLLRLDDAEATLRECVAMRQKLFGERDPRTAKPMDILGRVLREKGDFAGAAKYNTAAMRIREETVGKETQDYSESLQSMAFLCEANGKLVQAKGYYERAIALRKKLHGEGDPRIPELLHGMSTVCEELGDYGKAEALVRECIAKTRAAYGPRHYFVVHGLLQLADILSVTGRPDEASKAVQEAAGLIDKSHPLWPLLLMTRGNISRDAKHYAEAVKDYAEAEHLYRTGGQRQNLVLALQNLGTTLVTIPGRGAEAVKDIRAAVKLRSELSGANHPDTLYERILCIDVLRYLRKYPEADRELRALEPSIPPQSPLRKRLATTAVNLYRAWGKPDQEKRWAERSTTR